MEDEKKPANPLRGIARALRESSASRPLAEKGFPRIVETVHVSDGLSTLFRGSPNDPEALKWLD